jgi:hypothetical protein
LLTQSESSPYTQYLNLFLKSSESISDTFLFSLILVISSGVGLSQDSLDEGDMNTVTFMMGLMFIGFNLYYFYKSYFEGPIILMFLMIWYISRLKFSVSLQVRRLGYLNFRTEQQGTVNRRDFGVFRIKLIRILTDFLFLSTVSFHVVNGIYLWFELRVTEDNFTGLLACRECFALIWITVNCIIFCPGLWSVSSFEEHFSLKKDDFFEGNICPLNERLLGNSPVILVSPWYQGFNPEKPYDGISIAIPLELKAINQVPIE